MHFYHNRPSPFLVFVAEGLLGEGCFLKACGEIASAGGGVFREDRKLNGLGSLFGEGAVRGKGDHLPPETLSAQGGVEDDEPEHSRARVRVGGKAEEPHGPAVVVGGGKGDVPVVLGVILK